MEKRVNHAEEAIRLIDECLAEQVEAEQLYSNWIKHGRSVVTEADITIEGSPDVVIYERDKQGLWD